MGKPEARIEKYLVEQVKLAGGVCYKLSASIINGIPDRIVVLNGHTIFAELKAPKGTPTRLQLLRQKEIKNAGGIATILYTHKQVDDFITSLTTTE